MGGGCSFGSIETSRSMGMGCAWGGACAWDGAWEGCLGIMLIRSRRSTSSCSLAGGAAISSIASSVAVSTWSARRRRKHEAGLQPCSKDSSGYMELYIYMYIYIYIYRMIIYKGVQPGSESRLGASNAYALSWGRQWEFWAGAKQIRLSAKQL